MSVMNKIDEAIIFATNKHEGQVRKLSSCPAVFHSFEVAQILCTMSSNEDLIAAGILHDVVEDANVSPEEIRAKFGERVYELVASETENKYESEEKSKTWLIRKQESISALKRSDDIEVKMLWLADKLSNLRSIASSYGEQEDSTWKYFNQKDPEMHRWYYKSIAENLEMYLNKTGAYKEFIKHINYIWPGTFETYKERYKKYKEISVNGCKLIGKGAKSEVYRLDDELIVKVYNSKNMFRDLERENKLARLALFAGIPTAISFGIVSVGDKYGSMFELIDSDCISALISQNPNKLTIYAQIMADLALTIHNTDAVMLGLDDYMPEVYKWVSEGLGYCDKNLAERINSLLDKLGEPTTAIHGDFHTGNVIMQRGEPLLIDMDRFSMCHPIVDLCGMYMAYIGLGELDPDVIENFMGFSYDICKEFYYTFLHKYFYDKSEDYINDANNKIALLCYVRLIRRVYKKGTDLSCDEIKKRDYFICKVKELLDVVNSFDIDRQQIRIAE